ncbi:MAG: Argininosuccinate synthase [Flavobacteriales bacterium]|nr:MAG: Argininosuccinate synthase [Flavobacteriales bacterium]
MKNKTIVLAYSGGLDTSYCLKKLSTEGFSVHALLINTGGFSKSDLNKIEKQAKKLGASRFISIDAEEEFYNKIIKFLIFGNVLKNNSYPLSVSSERIIQAIEIMNYSKKHNINNIAHGSTGAGNDQVRFDSIFQTLNPNIKIITPIRDNNISRKKEISYLKSMGINLTWNKSRYSINKGIWGTTIGGDETLTSNKPLPDKAFTKKLLEKRNKLIDLKFFKGELIGINNKVSNPIELINYLEQISSKYAIGRDIHVGDTVIGIKGRVGFEAAAAKIIIKSHELLEKHTMSKWQIFQKESISKLYGMLIHEGQYFDPVIKDIEAYFEKSQRYVTGNVFVELSPYNFRLNGIKSDHDLMNHNLGVYGEENTNWSSDDIKGFIKISSNSSKIFKQINK